MSSDDLTEKLPEGDRLDQLIAIVQDMKAQLTGLEQNYKSLEQNYRDMKAQLIGLEQKVEERLYDTRPLWERTLHEMAELRSEMGDRFDKLESGFRDLNRRVKFFASELTETRIKQEELEDRLDRFESRVEDRFDKLEKPMT